MYTHTHTHLKSILHLDVLEVGLWAMSLNCRGQSEGEVGKDLGEKPGSVFPTRQLLQETLHSTQPCSPSLLGNHFLV